LYDDSCSDGATMLGRYEIGKKQHIQNKTCRGAIGLNLFGECMSLLLTPGPQDDLGPNERHTQRHDIGGKTCFGQSDFEPMTMVALLMLCKQLC